MANALDPQKVHQWLKGQAKAQRIIERERRGYLSQLGTAEALQLYQGLLHSREHPSSDRPSVLLMAMRILHWRLCRKSLLFWNGTLKRSL